MRLFELIFLILQIAEFSLCWSTTFYFYPRDEDGRSVRLDAHDRLTESEQTIFIVHGFSSSGLSKNFQHLKDEFNKYVDANVIIVDWRGGAAAKSLIDVQAYEAATNNTRIVGRDIAEFIRINGIKPSLVTCVGHSLGAHVCGFTGKLTPGLGRISGPLFKEQDKSKRLNSRDAKFVDCIFTTELIGIADPICQVNFYPNGLGPQPKCKWITNLVCNHSAGLLYYAESIQGDPVCTFKATKCDTFDNFSNGTCLCSSSRNCIQMGFYAKNFPKAKGKFYLTTTEEPPYCIE